MSNLVAKSGNGTFVATFIVRDKDGKPKFTDPDNVPEKILEHLTDSDKEYLETLKQEK